MIQWQPTCKVQLKQILPPRVGNGKLGLEETLVTSTFQRNYISLYNSLQEAVIEMLLEVHLDKYSFFVLGFIYFETLSIARMTQN